ncbi:MAG TPA: hypothetical protein PL054_09255 [Clostridia bacterium]|nr:hypothetical protein [Clostridia bacterium]
MEQITDNIFRRTEFIVSKDNKYLVYKLWKENSSDRGDNYVYTVSDDQRYIKTVIKVVDLTKGEIVKVGTIYEETTQSGQRVELAFDEAGNAYIKYGSYNFVITTD